MSKQEFTNAECTTKKRKREQNRKDQNILGAGGRGIGVGRSLILGLGGGSGRDLFERSTVLVDMFLLDGCEETRMNVWTWISFAGGASARPSSAAPATSTSMSQLDDSVRFVDRVSVRGRLSISSLPAFCALSSRRGDITASLGVSYRHFGLSNDRLLST